MFGLSLVRFVLVAVSIASGVGCVAARELYTLAATFGKSREHSSARRRAPRTAGRLDPRICAGRARVRSYTTHGNSHRAGLNRPLASKQQNRRGLPEGPIDSTI